MSKVPVWLGGRLAALVLMTGVGSGTYMLQQAHVRQGMNDAYVQAVAGDKETSMAVKIAMVMGWYYESSGKHIGKPYVDKLGKGQPLTVCNGITGVDVIAGKWYSPDECYSLEKGRYLVAERYAQQHLNYWIRYDPMVQATFLDFIHNKGEGALQSSTMLRKANAGDLNGACRENPRWKKGTVNGVKQILPGLQGRGDSNEEICTHWRLLN